MFYDIFSQLCKSKEVSPSRACLDMNLSRSLGAKWKNTGANPSYDVLTRMSDYFGVSTDYLLGNSEQKEKPALTNKDEQDIAKELERIRESLENADGLMFYGDPMTDDARESILAAMKLGLEAAKLKNKEKYTPKKFKKD